MNNKTAIDRIDECGVLIAGYCNAAEIILETALGDLDQMIKTKAIMKAAADTIKNEIESAQFLIYEIHKNADAIDDTQRKKEYTLIPQRQEKKERSISPRQLRIFLRPTRQSKSRPQGNGQQGS